MDPRAGWAVSRYDGTISMGLGGPRARLPRILCMVGSPWRLLGTLKYDLGVLFRCVAEVLRLKAKMRREMESHQYSRSGMEVNHFLMPSEPCPPSSSLDETLVPSYSLGWECIACGVADARVLVLGYW